MKLKPRLGVFYDSRASGAVENRSDLFPITQTELQ